MREREIANVSMRKSYALGGGRAKHEREGSARDKHEREVHMGRQG